MAEYVSVAEPRDIPWTGDGSTRQTLQHVLHELPKLPSSTQSAEELLPCKHVAAGVPPLVSLNLTASLCPLSPAGPPQGVVLSHRAMVSVIAAQQVVLDQVVALTGG